MRGLTAWKVAFEHDRRKPVRGGVHRRSEPRFLVAGLPEMSESVSASLVVVAGVPDDQV